MTVSINSSIGAVTNYMRSVADNADTKVPKKQRVRLISSGEELMAVETANEIPWFLRFFACAFGQGPAHLREINRFLRKHKSAIEKEDLDDEDREAITAFVRKIHVYNKKHIFFKKIKNVVSFSLSSNPSLRSGSRQRRDSVFLQQEAKTREKAEITEWNRVGQRIAERKSIVEFKNDIEKLTKQTELSEKQRSEVKEWSVSAIKWSASLGGKEEAQGILTGLLDFIRKLPEREIHEIYLYVLKKLPQQEWKKAILLWVLDQAFTRVHLPFPLHEQRHPLLHLFYLRCIFEKDFSEEDAIRIVKRYYELGGMVPAKDCLLFLKKILDINDEKLADVFLQNLNKRDVQKWLDSTDTELADNEKSDFSDLYRKCEQANQLSTGSKQKILQILGAFSSSDRACPSPSSAMKTDREICQLLKKKVFNVDTLLVDFEQAFRRIHVGFTPTGESDFILYLRYLRTVYEAECSEENTIDVLEAYRKGKDAFKGNAFSILLYNSLLQGDKKIADFLIENVAPEALLEWLEDPKEGKRERYNPLCGCVTSTKLSWENKISFIQALVSRNISDRLTDDQLAIEGVSLVDFLQDNKIDRALCYVIKEIINLDWECDEKKKFIETLNKKVVFGEKTEENKGSRKDSEIIKILNQCKKIYTQQENQLGSLAASIQKELDNKEKLAKKVGIFDQKKMELKDIMKRIDFSI